jgi:hypothetical protein
MIRLLLLCPLLVPLALQPPQPAVILSSPNGLKATVTLNGLTRVELADGTAVTGDACAWVFQDFNHWFSKDDTDGTAVLNREVAPRKLDATPTAATFTQTWDGAVCATRYTLAGDDILAEVAVTCTADKPLRYWGFSGLELAKGEPVREPVNLPVWNADYTRFAQGGGMAVLSPSHWIRLRAAQAARRDGGGKSWGFAGSTKGLGPVGLLWTAPQDAVRLIVRRDVVPTETVRFQVRLRFSRATGRDALFSGYYQDHVAEFGPLQYDVDQRPWVVFQRFGPEAVTKENPYGYHTFPNWRLDTQQGAHRMGLDLAQVIKTAACQGLLCWGFGHYLEPGDWGYSVNFHAMPQAVKAAVPSLIAQLKSAGLRTGHLMRPGNVTVKGSWEKANYLPVEDTPAFRTEMLRRARVLTDLGVTASYVDDNLPLEPVKLLWWLRPRLGRGYAWYIEFSSDLTAPVGGVYCELQGRPERPSVPEYVEILRQMYPQLPVLVRNRTALSTPEYVRWCAQNRYTAAVDDWPLITEPGLTVAVHLAYRDRLAPGPGGGWVWK